MYGSTPEIRKIDDLETKIEAFAQCLSTCVCIELYQDLKQAHTELNEFSIN